MTVTLGDTSYQVMYDPDVTDTDITAHVISIDKCTDVANEINTGLIQINAEFGHFMTESSSGATPILATWDKIKITLTDNGDNVYSRIFLVKEIVRKRTANENLRLELHLVGQEYWLSVIPFPKPFYFENAFVMSRDIIDIFNNTNGTAQATIENHDDKTENTLPEWTANTNTFGLKEMYCWDGLQWIINNLGNAVSDLGAGEFYFLHFRDKASTPGTIEMETAVSGATGTTQLQNTLTNPIYRISERLDSETGTIVGVKGARDFGSLPVESATFRSKLEAFRLIPEHSAGETYPSGTWVQKSGVWYQSNAETTQTPNDTEWDIKNADDFIGAIDYSPWTNGEADSWKNSGSNASGAAGGTGVDFDQEGCWDGNLVILDEDNYQNWAHIKSTTDGFDVNYKYGAASGGVYEGLRCLVNGTGTGAFVGFDNKIMQYDGSAWQEIGPTGTSGVRTPVDGDRCGIDHEGLVYKFDGANWVDDHSGGRNNHCYHVYDSVGQSVGSNTTDDGAGGTYGTGSAVKYVYKYTAFSAIATSAIATNVNFYSVGAWANIQAPFPTTNHNSKTMGTLYGGDSTTKQPSTFDSDNLIYTPTGKNGFNETDSSSLYPFTGIGMNIRMNWFTNTVLTLGSDTTIPLQADFKYRVYMYDTSDNIVYADHVIPYLQYWSPFRKNFSEFKIYRARAHLGLGNVATNYLLPELLVEDVFNFRDIKKICIQWQESYDNEGRFAPDLSRAMSVPGAMGDFLPGITETTIELEIDNFHFTKQLFEVSGMDTTRPQFVFKESPHASNSFQTEQLGKSQVEIEKHPYREFDIDMELRCDIAAENSFYLIDGELINDNDDATGGVKLVAREINYTVNAADGTGGIQTHMLGVKRIG